MSAEKSAANGTGLKLALDTWAVLAALALALAVRFGVIGKVPW
ncbi:MAG TPA: hypothetical protein VGM18_03335 [Candidatus Sulfotelmatobacter sp.]|jgi:hypothetical protein